MSIVATGKDLFKVLWVFTACSNFTFYFEQGIAFFQFISRFYEILIEQTR